MTNGIILAGGRGSRLGPLAAQISKALVSIGQRPHLAHQVELLKNSGCDRIVVVTSADTDVQVRNMISRAGLDVGAIVQLQPRGPVDAIRTGMEIVDVNQPTIVMMADTYVDEPLPDGSWIAVGDAPYTRSFCFRSGDSFVDGTASPGRDVTIGAYRFEDTMAAYGLAAAIVRKHTVEMGPVEVGMAPFLTEWSRDQNVAQIQFASWQDLGDVKALARARQTKFIARDHHQLVLSNYGTLTKSGNGPDFLRQGSWMNDVANDPDPRVANLVPRIFEFDGTGSSYSMEFIDLPTLSELWLYWPGRPDTWADMLQTVLDRMEPLWRRDQETRPWKAEDVGKLFVDKAVARVSQVDARFGSRWGTRLEDLLDEAGSFFDDDELVRAHGDLNFNNILFSLNTGMVKLVDPRGDDALPLIYEFAKLRYSYHGGFSAITHGLTQGDTLLPNRVAETRAMDEVLARYYDLDTLRVAEGLLLIAGSALHPRNEAEVMLKRGESLLGGVL